MPEPKIRSPLDLNQDSVAKSATTNIGGLSVDSPAVNGQAAVVQADSILPSPMIRERGLSLNSNANNNNANGNGNIPLKEMGGDLKGNGTAASTFKEEKIISTFGTPGGKGNRSMLSADNLEEDDDADARDGQKKTWASRLKDWTNPEYIRNHIRPPIMITMMVVTYYTVAYLLMHDDVAPGTTLFSLAVVVICGIFGGVLATKFNAAPLLGMLLIGIIVRNIPGLISPLPQSLTSKLRSIALTIILSRAGIGLQKETIISNAKATVLMGVVPVLCEALMNSLMVALVYQYPADWSLMLGFGLSSVSPGVVVPLLLGLKDENYGIRSGVTPIMLAATGLDVVVGITGFSVCSGIVFSESDFAMTVLQGPIELFGGIGAGLILGLFIYVLEKLKTPLNFRVFIVVGFGLVSMLGGKSLGYSGAASLSTMIAWCCVANLWERKTVEITAKKLKMIWEFAQPFLFPIIGASIYFPEISLDTVKDCSIVVVIGIITRMSVVYMLTSGVGGFTTKEKLFMAGGWTAKATVQAALSYVTLEIVQEKNLTGVELGRATEVFHTMVFAILIGAPFCATWIQFWGKRWLTKDQVLPGEDPNELFPDVSMMAEPSGLGLLKMAQKQMNNLIQEEKKSGGGSGGGVRADATPH